MWIKKEQHGEKDVFLFCVYERWQLPLQPIPYDYDIYDLNKKAETLFI